LTRDFARISIEFIGLVILVVILWDWIGLVNENNDLKKEIKVLQSTMQEKHRKEIQQREKDEKELSLIQQELKLQKDFRRSLEARHQTLQQERDILSHSHNALTQDNVKIKDSFSQVQLDFEKKFQEEIQKKTAEVSAIKNQLKLQKKDIEFLELQNKSERQQRMRLLDSYKGFIQGQEQLKKIYSEEIEVIEKEASRLQKELELQKEEHKSLQVQQRAHSIAQEQDNLKKIQFKEVKQREKVKRERFPIKDGLKVLKECHESLQAQHKALKQERDDMSLCCDALAREHQKLKTD